MYAVFKYLKICHVEEEANRVGTNDLYVSLKMEELIKNR